MRQAISPRLAMRIFSNIRTRTYRRNPHRNKLALRLRLALFHCDDIETDETTADLKVAVIVEQTEFGDLLNAGKSGGF